MCWVRCERRVGGPVFGFGGVRVMRLRVRPELVATSGEYLARDEWLAGA